MLTWNFFSLHPGVCKFIETDAVSGLSLKRNLSSLYCLCSILFNRLPGNDPKVTFVIRETDIQIAR